MSDALSALQAQVAATDTVIQSAITLINGISAEITAAGTDQAALAQLTQNLNAQTAALANAVAAAPTATATVAGGAGASTVAGATGTPTVAASVSSGTVTGAPGP